MLQNVRKTDAPEEPGQRGTEVKMTLGVWRGESCGSVLGGHVFFTHPGYTETVLHTENTDTHQRRLALLLPCVIQGTGPLGV